MFASVYVTDQLYTQSEGQEATMLMRVKDQNIHHRQSTLQPVKASAKKRMDVIAQGTYSQAVLSPANGEMRSVQSHANVWAPLVK